MGDFLKGWRRKIGVLALVMACVFMGWWLRSLVVKDHIEFSKFINIAKKDQHLAGLATDRQSLVVLVYKVEELLCRTDENSVSYSSSQTGEVEKIESIPVSVSMLSATMLNVPSGMVSHPTAVATNQPTMLTNPVADQESALLATDAGAPMFTPFPTSMASNPAAEISIRTIPTQPSLSVLSSVSILPLVAVPFWSAVIPLTLLSAWLLLTKPRKAIQIKTVEPIPEMAV